MYFVTTYDINIKNTEEMRAIFYAFTTVHIFKKFFEFSYLYANVCIQKMVANYLLSHLISKSRGPFGEKKKKSTLIEN